MSIFDIKKNKKAAPALGPLATKARTILRKAKAGLKKLKDQRQLRDARKQHLAGSVDIATAEDRFTAAQRSFAREEMDEGTYNDEKKVHGLAVAAYDEAQDLIETLDDDIDEIDQQIKARRELLPGLEMRLKTAHHQDLIDAIDMETLKKAIYFGGFVGLGSDRAFSRVAKYRGDEAIEYQRREKLLLGL